MIVRNSQGLFLVMFLCCFSCQLVSASTKATLRSRSFCWGRRSLQQQSSPYTKFHGAKKRTLRCQAVVFLLHFLLLLSTTKKQAPEELGPLQSGTPNDLCLFVSVPSGLCALLAIIIRVQVLMGMQ